MVAITFLIIVILTLITVFTVSAAFLGWNTRDLRRLRMERLKTEQSKERARQMLQEKEHLWDLLSDEEKQFIRDNIDLSR